MTIEEALDALEAIDKDPPQEPCGRCDDGIQRHEHDNNIEPRCEQRCGWCWGDNEVFSETGTREARRKVLAAFRMANAGEACERGSS